jgi:hypothetical protein
MNVSQAMRKINPQSMSYEPKVDGHSMSGCSYEDALGFVSSCHGEAALAHYSLMPTGDTCSRKACAREIAIKLGLTGLDLIEAEIEVFVNRHEPEKSAAVGAIRESVYALLSEWENGWMRALGECDRE